MRKRFGQALRIGVSTSALSLLKTSRWGGAGPELVAEHRFTGDLAPGFDAMVAALRQMLADAGCSGWSATVVLSDDLSRLWQVTPPPGATRMADLEGAAALRFQLLFGESAAQWQLAAGWDATRPFLAAAMPVRLLALLREAAAEQGVTLVEIVPQFVAAWNRWRDAVKPGAWYGLVQGGVLTLGVVDDARVQAVRAAAIPSAAGVDWLAQHVAREALRLNVAAPSRLQVSGPAPSSWNQATGGFMCSLLQAGGDSTLSPASVLAATGVAA